MEGKHSRVEGSRTFVRIDLSAPRTVPVTWYKKAEDDPNTLMVQESQGMIPGFQR
jgi:hypothetical protein